MDAASAAADLLAASQANPMDLSSNSISSSSADKGKGRCRRGLPADLVAVSSPIFIDLSIFLDDFFFLIDVFFLYWN